MHKLSIIVPVFNAESTIEKCVNSILSQTFEDFELILIDDGSIDNSLNLCYELAKKDERIIVFQKENEGPAKTRNFGINVSQGKYIMFCDSDDYVEKNWCYNYIKKIEGTEYNFVFGGIKIKFNHDKNETSKWKINFENFSNWEVILSLILDNKIGYPCNVCFYSEILKKYDIYFPSNVVVEDLPFIIDYLLKMKTFTFTCSYDYNYCQVNLNSQSRKFKFNNFIRWKEKYIKLLEFNDKVLKGSDDGLNKISTVYLYYFLNSLNSVFDEENNEKLINNFNYFKSVVKDDYFQKCLVTADCSNENEKLIKLLKKKKYLLLFVIQYLKHLYRR